MSSAPESFVQKRVHVQYCTEYILRIQTPLYGAVLRGCNNLSTPFNSPTGPPISATLHLLSLHRSNTAHHHHINYSRPVGQNHTIP
ncbi:hypothetical protein B9Z19DRAFT_1070935 [Tuber borchii]|uniref:Uncharacterized protein n=1 Tax=Tuber borchii TaxID=42251 RepID=A0A2T7A8L0_TUBBO|nr:hypothetical protein B9Z19DRAFT_1070935 [Tuber borchii]